MGACQPGSCSCTGEFKPVSNSSSDLSATEAETFSGLSFRHKKWLILAIGILAAITAEVIAWTTGDESSWPVIAFAMIAIAAGGTQTYRKGWVALTRLDLNINALMAIAVTVAAFIGQWPEAAMVMVLFSLAERIEALSLDRARNAIRELMAMTPECATVKQTDGIWKEVDAKSVSIGMQVRVKPGERIPLDGKVLNGQSSVNQAPITGESIPVSKSAGDPVFAGTINETGSFEYRVTADATHSTLARIIHAVEEAQGKRAPTQRFIDKFAKTYTPAVFAVAILVAVMPPLVLGLSWNDWVYKALVIIVIACPCALVISTPVTIVSGLAAAANRGILIKGGTYLEEGRKLKILALDKTGTITLGKPSVTDVLALNGNAAEALRLAASLAARSDHPVSSAIRAHAKMEAGDETSFEDFAAIPGQGVKGRLGDRWIHLGNYRMIRELGIRSPAMQSALARLEAEGKTAVAICDGSTPLAVIGVADQIRHTSRQAVADLHALGVRTIMLTGDNRRTAVAIAESVGIDDARGELLPEDKLRAIAELVENSNVGMVGDGINDAPALAMANIGFAMGVAGSDTAIETADVALMDDDLGKIPEFIRLSGRTASLLKQNITIALGIKGLFFALAIAGKATLWMAVFADMGASLIVVFNGLRLLKALPYARKEKSVPEIVPASAAGT